jgi:hypothetical protein
LKVNEVLEALSKADSEAEVEGVEVVRCRKGRIPKRMIAYIKSSSSSVIPRETPKFSKFTARAAFVVPSNSDAFKSSAGKWASESQYGGKAKLFDTNEFVNSEFTDLRWVGIESRGEGGVVYKVLTPQGWLVDLREDVVTECLLEGAIENKNGPQGVGTYFTAEFIWVVMGSQVRIVRVGSTLFKEIADSQTLRGMGPIPEKDLEIGGIYMKSNGNFVAILDFGTEKGRKFLAIEDRSCGSEKLKSQVLNSIQILDSPSAYPYWYWCGSVKVVKQIGQVDLPKGLGKRFDDHIQDIRNGSVRWNNATS